MTVKKCVVLGGSDNRQAYGVEGDPVRLKRIAFALSIALGKCAGWQTALRLSNSPPTSKRRTLLQSLNVRPMLDADGKETGMFVPADGPDTRRWSCWSDSTWARRHMGKTAHGQCSAGTPLRKATAHEGILIPA
jgi:hypothetical protein